LSFFDIESGEELARIPLPAGAEHPFDFDPVGGGWFTGGTRGVMFWPLRSEPGRPASLRVGPPQSILPGPGNQLWCDSGASKNGRHLAITDVTSTILIHRDVAGPPLKLGPQAGMGSSEISPDGKWVATCSGRSEGRTQSVQVWDGQDGHRVADLRLAGGSCQAAFSPDNQWLATFDLREEAQLWKVGSWETPERSFAAGRIVFSPDGQLMALNDVIGCLRLLKISSCEEVARVTGPEPRTYWPLCFTPDGTKLFALGDGLCVWDLRLIREQLSEMGLDWDHKDWPPFPPTLPDSRGRLRLTVDTRMSANEGPGAATPFPQEPTLEQRDAK
jgi:WD40 repeat protein